MIASRSNTKRQLEGAAFFAAPIFLFGAARQPKTSVAFAPMVLAFKAAVSVMNFDVTLKKHHFYKPKNTFARASDICDAPQNHSRNGALALQ